MEQGDAAVPGSSARGATLAGREHGLPERQESRSVGRRFGRTGIRRIQRALQVSAGLAVHAAHRDCRSVSR